MLSGARALSLAVRLVRPLALALGGLGKAVRRALRLGEEQSWATVSRRALRERFAEGAAQGVFSGPQRLLVENVLQSASRPALGAGRPLGEGNALPADATAGDLLARAGGFPSSRVPVYEGDPERVVGVVHVLKAWGADRDARLGDLALPPVWLDADASVVQALASLRRAQSTVGFIARGPGETGAREVVTAEGLLRHMIAGAGSGAPRRP
jgi:putative hemolysin